MQTRNISVIAAEIRLNWTKPYFGAMESLNTINDKFGCDNAKSMIAYFLCNASTWRGETAKRIKAELKTLIK